MSRSVSIVVACLALTLLPTQLPAQRRPPGPQAVPTDSLMAIYDSRLNLSDEQATDLRAILEIQAEETRNLMDRARAAGPDAMRDLRSELTELRRETDLLVEAILTEEQVPEYREIQEEIRERMRNRAGNRRPPPPPGG